MRGYRHRQIDKWTIGRPNKPGKIESVSKLEKKKQVHTRASPLKKKKMEYAKLNQTKMLLPRSISGSGSCTGSVGWDKTCLRDRAGGKSKAPPEYVDIFFPSSKQLKIQITYYY